MEKTSKELVKFAKMLRASGFNPMFAKQKAPIASWAKYQRIPLSDLEIEAIAETTNADQMGVITGYGGLFVIDFDTKTKEPLTANFETNSNIEVLREKISENSVVTSLLLAVVSRLHPDTLSKIYIETTPSGGYHLFAIAESPPHSGVIARHRDGAVAVEIKGVGGFIVTAPSKNYKPVHNEITKLVKLSETELADLLTAVMSLNNNDLTSNEPGEVDEFLNFLTQHGWKVIGQNSKVFYLQRPNKPDKGCSATLNKDLKLLYVFSTNAQPFEPNKAYTLASARNLLLGKELPPSKSRKLQELALIKGELLKLGIWKFNILRQRYELHTHNGVTIISDRLRKKLHIDFYERGHLVSLDFFNELIDAVSEDTNPVFEYFQRLEPLETGGIKEFASFVKCKTETRWTIALNYFKRFFTAAVAQVLGVAKNDYALILWGKQGVGKSSFLRSLAPPELKEYLVDAPLITRDKDFIMMAGGNLIVNLDDLDGLYFRDSSFLKSIFSQEDFVFRRPYDKHLQTLPRINSFVGSCNKRNFLDDFTGARRFLVVEVEEIDFSFKNFDITRVWSEAKWLLLNGFRFWLNREETKQINAYNERYQTHDLETELVFSNIKEQVNNGDEVFHVTASDVLLAFQKVFDLKNLKVKNIGSALQRLGHYPEIRKINGRTYQLYEIAVDEKAFELANELRLLAKLTSKADVYSNKEG
jgi:Asp-tRNA(Asn)/Glu-tRNA(Gln) amidotransferase C subunit